MMLSGPKSYYDDYLRKQGTGRTLADPPSLLTDRGAYVNFLEVQLERVSAACLGVQSYDQRFNDMQALIVSLEQRCGQTTRLLALSQQCIEEIRTEADNKLSAMTKDIKEEHRNMHKSFEVMSCRIGIAERAISSMAGLQPQIEILEKRITNDANNVNIEIKKSEERNQILQERLLVISNSIADVTLKLEKSNTAASKLTLNVDEIERKSNNMLSATEVRLRNEVVSDREEMKKKFQTVQVRITSETERIQNEIIKSALNASTISRRQFEDTLERIENTKKSLFEELERKCSRIQENSEEESSALKQKFKNQCASLDSVVDQMQQNTMITPISGASTPVNESIVHLKGQLLHTSNNLEFLQKAVELMESKTKNVDTLRNQRDDDFKKDLNNIKIKIEELSQKPKNQEKIHDSNEIGTENENDKENLLRQTDGEEYESKSKNKMKFSSEQDHNFIKQPRNERNSKIFGNPQETKLNLNAILNNKNLSKEDLMSIIALAIGKASALTSTSTSTTKGSENHLEATESMDPGPIDSEEECSESNKSGRSNKLIESKRRSYDQYDVRKGDNHTVNLKMSTQDGFGGGAELKDGHQRSIESYNYNDNKNNDNDNNNNNDSNQIIDSKSHDNDSISNNRSHRQIKESSRTQDRDSRMLSRSLDGLTLSSTSSSKVSNNKLPDQLQKSSMNEKYDTGDDDNDSRRMNDENGQDEKKEIRNYDENKMKEIWCSQSSHRERGPSSSSSLQRQPLGHRVAFNSKLQGSPGRSGKYDRAILDGPSQSDNDNINSRNFESENDGQLEQTDDSEFEGGRGRGRGSKDRQRGETGTKALRPSFPSPFIPSTPASTIPSSVKVNGLYSTSSATDSTRKKSTHGVREKVFENSKRGSSRGSRIMSSPDSDRTASLRTGRTRSIVHTSSSPDRYISSATPNSAGTTVSTSTGTGTRLAEDPIREVLSKFLDIYQLDQNHIKSKLEKLAHPTEEGIRMDAYSTMKNNIRRGERSEGEIQNHMSFNSERNSNSTRTGMKLKDRDTDDTDGNGIYQVEDMDIKKESFVNQYESGKKIKPSSQQAENILRSNELFRRYGEGEINNSDDDGNNYSGHSNSNNVIGSNNNNSYDNTSNNKNNNNKKNKSNKNNSNNDNSYDNNDNDHSYDNNSNSNDNNYYYSSNNNNNSNSNININSNDHNGNTDDYYDDDRSNRNNNFDHENRDRNQSKYAENIRNSNNSNTESNEQYRRNGEKILEREGERKGVRGRDRESEREESRNYDNNDNNISFDPQQKKKKITSQTRHQRLQFSISPKRDSKFYNTSTKISLSTDRKKINSSGGKYSILKSSNNGSSSSSNIKRKCNPHWIPNKSISPVHYRGDRGNHGNHADVQEPHRTFTLTSRTTKFTGDTEKTRVRDADTHTKNNDRIKDGKNEGANSRENRRDKRDEKDLNASVTSRASRDDRVFSSYNGRGSDDDCSIFTSTTMTSIGQEKRTTSSSQNSRIGSLKTNSNRRVSNLVSSNARIK